MTSKSKDMGKVMKELVTGLCAIMIAIAVALPASADFLANRSPEAFFAKEEFSTYTPLKGKIPYDYKEKGVVVNPPVYKVSCKGLQAMVGKGSKIKSGAKVMLTGKGVCNITNTLAIHKGVTIVASSMPTNPSFDYMRGIDAGLKTHGNKFPAKINCATHTAPCITINVGPNEFAGLAGFHIKVNSRLLAPLVESRSGGIVLKSNFLEGEYRPKATGDKERPLGYSRATAVLVHGSNAIIEKNTISYARSGVALLPSQKAAKGSLYKLEGNHILRMDESGVFADGSIFYVRPLGNPFEAPSRNRQDLGNLEVKVSMIANAIDADISGYYAKRVDSTLIANTFNPEYLVYKYFDDLNRDKICKKPEKPKKKKSYRRDAVPQEPDCPPQSFRGSQSYVVIEDGVAKVSYNVFRDAARSAISVFARPRLHIDNNLFDHNQTVMLDHELAEAFMSRSPFPSGNICREQNFESQYTAGAGDVYEIIMEGEGDAIPGEGNMISLRRTRDNSGLWNAFDRYWMGFDCVNEDGGRSKRCGKRKPKKMWDAFMSYHNRTKDQIMAHSLFERPDVNSGEGYKACMDYSTVYKIVGAFSDNEFFGGPASD